MGAKIQFGGEKKGLFKFAYQLGIACLVILLEIKPTNNEIIIPIRQ